MGKGFLRSWLSIVATISLLATLAPGAVAQSNHQPSAPVSAAPTTLEGRCVSSTWSLPNFVGIRSDVATCVAGATRTEAGQEGSAAASQSAEGSEQAGEQCEPVAGDDWCEEWVATFDAGEPDVELTWPYAVLSPDGKQLFMTGYEFQDSSQDIVTAAFDTATGQNLWAARYPAGAPAVSQGGIAVSPDGTRVFVVGTQGETSASRDIVTLAYNAAPPQEPGAPELGERLWVATFASGPKANGGKDIAVTPDGSTVVVVGNRSESSGDRADIVTIAYDAATGEKRWLSTHGEPGLYDDIDGLALSPDGQFAYATGYVDCCSTLDPDVPARAVTIAYAVGGVTAGETSWVAEYARPGAATNQGWQVAVSENGARVFIAAFVGSSGDATITTLAYDATSGEQLWAAEYAGGEGANYPVFKRDGHNGIAASPNDDLVFVTGEAASVGCSKGCHIPVLAYEQATGELRWSQTYSGEHLLNDKTFGSSVASSPDGSRVFVGGADFDTPNGPKFDSSGTNSVQVVLAYESRSGERIAVARYPGAKYFRGYTVLPNPDGRRVYATGPLGWGPYLWALASYLAPSGPEPTPTPTGTASASPSPVPTNPSPSPTPTPRTTHAPGERGSYPLTPNDPYFGPGEDFGTAGLVRFGTQWGPQTIGAPQAWQESRATGHDIVVAVLDTGVDLGHPDLKCPGKLEVVPGSDVVSNDSDPKDENGHGTHVAGIIGACTNNGTGIAGVAPDASIMPIRVLNAAGSGTDEQLIAGIERAVEAGADVINMSLGYPPGKEIINDVSGIDAAIEAAAAQGVVIVAAAGNDSFPLCEYPALAEDVICVGATDARDNKAWYSTFANKAVGPAVVAPGGSEPVFCDVHSENILSLYPKSLDRCNEGISGYHGLNGTSMAAPHVAGVGALVYDRLGGERSPENAQKVIDALTSTAVDLGAPGYDPVYGSGRVDALAAVQSIPAGDPDPTPTPAETATASPSPTESGSASPSPSQSPQPGLTEVAFTDNTAESGQHSDETRFEARLTDSSGEPIEGRELTFELRGSESTRSFTATTDADGVASVSPTLDEKPGPYQLTVRFAGDEEHAGDADTASFIVEKEDSALELTETKGKDKALVASLYDADTPADGIAGRTIDFYAGPELIGSDETNSDGVATFTPPKQKGKPQPYEARFEGDDFYLGSSDDKPGKGANGGGSGGRDASMGYGGKVLLM